jgi:hypothetical protein
MSSKTLVSAIAIWFLSMPVAASADHQLAELPAFVSNHLMASMRDHLEALEEITLLLSEHQYDKAAKRTEQNLGISSIEIHYERHAGKYMPVEMQILAKEMHRAASRLATSIRNAEKDGGLNNIVAALSNTINRCVVCHNAYRLK